MELTSDQNAKLGAKLNHYFHRMKAATKPDEIKVNDYDYQYYSDFIQVNIFRFKDAEDFSLDYKISKDNFSEFLESNGYLTCEYPVSHGSDDFPEYETYPLSMEEWFDREGIIEIETALEIYLNQKQGLHELLDKEIKKFV
jgi:hypothetical protein